MTGAGTSSSTIAAGRVVTTPAAVAVLRAKPGFAEAMRTSAAGLVAMYEGSHLLNWLMDDRARLLFGYFALYLDFAYDPATPGSGLTPTRMKELCVELDICSPGRAGAMLSLMRYGGYLAPAAEVTDRRRRRLTTTEKLSSLIERRIRLHFTAMAPLMPDGETLQRALDDPAFFRGLIIAMFRRFRAGVRLMREPAIGVFSERNAGLLILASLLTAGEDGDGVPPQRPVRFSISAPARRFKVSRTHVLKMIRDAEAEGLLERLGAEGERILIRPRLAEAAKDFFAAFYIFFADCAHEALGGESVR